MQPADIAINLRRRTPWEAMDLGLAMLQNWWRQVYLPHLVIGVPISAVALALAWHFERAWLAMLIVWWLKPLNDRVVLHVLSHAVFGEMRATRQVLARPGEWLRTGLLSYLLVRWWPDTMRSFRLPVRQLEGQRAKPARARMEVLGRRAGGYATLLTLTSLALEFFVLATSFGLIAQLFLPAKASEGTSLLEFFFGASANDEDAPYFGFDDAIAYALAVLVMEPFYVAAGFALYLNRRTLLEGWDIEVALRRIAQRHAPALLLLVLGSAAFLLEPASVKAQERDPKSEIAEVLKAKEFGYYKDVKRWQSREKDAKGIDLDTTWLRAIGYAFAKASELALWIGAAALVAFALWWAARMLPQFRAPPPEPYRPPAALFGMDLAPDKLPQDVSAAAAALARAGKLREALGLLYRGALSVLVHKRGVQLLASHTEGEVLRLAGEPYLQQLVSAWQRCAYADRAPSVIEVEQLATDYPSAFA